jgi:16S rRNA (guanine527-N7)-methyltransferase
MAERLTDDATQDKLNHLTELLLKAPMNVTGFRTAEDLWVHGVLDACFTIQALDMAGVEHGVDVGSGGGFPGMVLAILYPQVEWCLVESRVKRADYLELMARTLDLQNVTVYAERAEDLVQDDTSWRESAQIVTARAVGPLTVAAELSVPFMAVDGFGLFAKGASHAEDEVRIAKPFCKELGASVFSISDPYGTDGNSRLITLKKYMPTPVRFPRKARYLGDHS